MANKKFKPYKAKKTRDIYSKYDERQVKDDNSLKADGIKLFGFRSGKSYKMIPAMAYYVLITGYLILSVYGEFTTLKFEPMDVILEILKYVFIFVAFLSPAIFLSDFKYVDSIPVFKNHNPGSSSFALFLVILFCVGMMQVNIYCMSDTYKESVKQYDIEYQKKLDKVNETRQSVDAVLSETTTVVETTN